MENGKANTSHARRHSSSLVLIPSCYREMASAVSRILEYGIVYSKSLSYALIASNLCKSVSGFCPTYHLYIDIVCKTYRNYRIGSYPVIVNILGIKRPIWIPSGAAAIAIISVFNCDESPRYIRVCYCTICYFGTCYGTAAYL